MVIFVIFFPVIFNSSSIFIYKVTMSPGDYSTKFWQGCAACERPNPLISKEDERTK